MGVPQPDRAEHYSPFREVFPNGRVRFVQCVATGDESDQAARPDHIDLKYLVLRTGRRLSRTSMRRCGA